MAVNRSGRVKTNVFAGFANIVGTVGLGLYAIVKTILQELARSQVRRLGLPPLVDSSGGTAGAAIAAVTVPPVADTSSSGGATVASVNTAADTVMDAFAVIVTRANKARAVLGMGSAPTGPGTVATAGTIAVVDDSVSAASGNNSASQATVALMFADLLSRQRVVVANVDEIRAAVGLDAVPITGTVQGDDADLDGLTMDAITNAAAVAAGTSATTGVALSAIDAQLDILSDNIALLADLLDEALTARRNRVYITVDIPATEYAAGTSVWAISPCNGRIRRMRSVVMAATTGAGALAIELATVPVTGLAVVIATSSSAGDIDDSGEVADHATQVVAEGQAMEITGDGTPSWGAVRVMIEIEPSEVSGALAAHVA